MASYTTNLNLKKPAGSENVAIGDINGNMDTIDTAYGSLNSKLNKFKLHTQNVTTNSTGSAMLNLTTSKIILGGTLDGDGHFRLDTYNGNWWVSDLTPNAAYTVTVMYYE